jgi:hypothetical protein
MRIDQSGIDQNPQMAADAGLQLPEAFGQLGDRQVALAQQIEDAQPGFLPGGAQLL